MHTHRRNGCVDLVSTETKWLPVLHTQNNSLFIWYGCAVYKLIEGSCITVYPSGTAVQVVKFELVILGLSTLR